MGATQETIESWFDLGKRFENPPRIKLELYSQVPPGQLQIGRAHV